MYELNNGYKIPDIAFGTGVILKYTRNPLLFLKTSGKKVISSIIHRKMNRSLKGDIQCGKILRQAYECGYTMFDTARIYGYSEKKIGKMSAGNIYVVTKVSDMDIERACSPHDVRGNLEVSLKHLKRGYLDAYLLHYPHGAWLDIYKEMESLYYEGTLKSLGICNCGIGELETIKAEGLITPMLLQIELHPLNSKKNIREYCWANGIQVMAHTPTGRMCEEIRKSEILNELSKVYQKAIPQIILRWHIQNQVIPVISTFDTVHMKENLDIYDFTLTDEEMERINNMDKEYVLLDSNGIDDPKYKYNL